MQVIIEVIRGKEKRSKIPVIGSIVTCKVLSMNQNQAKCAIHCVDDQVLSQPFRGLLRKEDVRQAEHDKVEMNKCFRTCDIILAKVIGFAENHHYLLTTAENELGVIVAQSDAGKLVNGENANNACIDSEWCIPVGVNA